MGLVATKLVAIYAFPVCLSTIFKGFFWQNHLHVALQKNANADANAD
jgi:hypothetical protein